MTIGDFQSPSRRDIKAAAAGNVQTYNYYYTRMRNLALSVYKWEGLPESCNARWLEKKLYYHGFAGFVPDPLLGWLSLQICPHDTINVYGDALRYTATSIGYDKDYDLKDIVIVRNNLTCIPTDFVVRQFAWRLYQIERAIDTNISATKTPLLLLTDDKRRLTVKNLYMQYDGNAPVVFGDKSLDPECIRVLKTDAPFLADKLTDQRAAIWAEFLTFIGIDNVGFEKRERLTNVEVESNNEHIAMGAEVGLMTRQEAAEELNRKAGCNCRCYLRSDDFTQPPEPDGTEDETEEEAIA